MRGISETPYFGWRDTNDLEDRVANWLARQESRSWIHTALVLGITFASMVLFAVSH